MMEIRKFKEKLDRYLKGTANETESAVVEAWYKSYQAEGKQQLNLSDQERIRHGIHSKLTKAIGQPVKIGWYYTRIAASVLLLSCISIRYYYVSKFKQSSGPKFITLQTHSGEVKQITLPDSSVIWVNAASRLRVPASFNGSLRQVFLEEGEAFFKVRHNIHKPFIVATPNLKVQVLGTSFNINTYAKLPQIKVAVATGKVSINQGNRCISVLMPGQELSYLRQNETYDRHKV
jgi:transmembrane sensor